MAKYAQLPDGTQLEFPDNTSDEVIDGVVKKHLGNPLINAARGFAARGNQAMNALNPFSSEESDARIAGEQEWVKQHPWANAGSIAADMAITAPVAGMAGAPTRAITTGLIEALTTPGDALDRATTGGISAAGAGIGEGLSKTLGYLAHPFRNAATPALKELQRKAIAMGIPLNAAQLTGNKSLQYIDSALDSLPSSSSSQQANKLNQRNVWQEKLFGLGNESANTPSQAVMGSMKDRISDTYKNIHSQNNMIVDRAFKKDLQDVSNSFMGRIPVNQKTIVKSYLRDFSKAPVGAQIKGSTYQDIRSMLDKQAKAFQNSDPATHEALKAIRSASDKAMLRSVSPQVGKQLKGANNDWAVMKNIEAGIDPTKEIISPAKLVSSLSRREPNRMIYGKGDQDLNDIAKVGKQFISEQLPDSGTAQRAAMIKLLTGAGVAGAGEEYARTGDPLSSGIGGLSALALATLLPKQASKLLWTQNGYLSKGLTDMTKEVLPGVTKQGLLDYFMRNLGNEVARQE